MRRVTGAGVAWAAVAGAALLGGCAAAPVAPASGPYGQWAALAGQVPNALAAGKVTGAQAIALNTELKLAKAELDAGLTAQAQTQLTSAAQELATDQKQ